MKNEKYTVTVTLNAIPGEKKIVTNFFCSYLVFSILQFSVLKKKIVISHTLCDPILVIGPSHLFINILHTKLKLDRMNLLLLSYPFNL